MLTSALSEDERQNNLFIVDGFATKLNQAQTSLLVNTVA